MTLIARRSFVADYDGERVPLFRGRTRVADDHELAHQHPDSWERETTRAQVEWRYRDRLASARDAVELEQMISAYSQILEANERRGVERGPLPLEVRH
jgi:hypothetical protein